MHRERESVCCLGRAMDSAAHHPSCASVCRSQHRLLPHCCWCVSLRCWRRMLDVMSLPRALEETDTQAPSVQVAGRTHVRGINKCGRTPFSLHLLLLSLYLSFLPPHRIEREDRSMSSGRIYKMVFGRPQPQWMWDMALELRIPALFFVGVVYVNTKCYYDALSAYQAGSRWGMTKGKLLEMEKHNYRYISVPRYSVKYEFEVDGQRYVSTRATTGSPYRDWMKWFYRDTITEAEYLQAIPVLRVGERCTVFYDKRNPKAHSALAQDANSFEISFLSFFAVFPLLMGYYMKAHFWMVRKAYMPNKKMRIRFPVYDHPKPPPPPPKEPHQISPIPEKK